jgi:hypothetical protein
MEINYFYKVGNFEKEIMKQFLYCRIIFVEVKLEF